MEAKLEWLDDPRVFRVGKLPAHSDHEIYRDKADYKAGNQADTLSLDGEWDFHYGHHRANGRHSFMIRRR